MKNIALIVLAATLFAWASLIVGRSGVGALSGTVTINSDNTVSVNMPNPCLANGETITWNFINNNPDVYQVAVSTSCTVVPCYPFPPLGFIGSRFATPAISPITTPPANWGPTDDTNSWALQIIFPDHSYLLFGPYPLYKCPSEGVPAFPSIYIGIGAALGAGLLAFVVRRRFVA